MTAISNAAAAAASRFVARARSAGPAAAFAAFGLPSQRQEAWHYTSLRPLLDVPFADPPHGPAKGDDLEFLNGRRASPHLPAVSPVPDDTLDALNLMLADDGADIAVPANQDGGTLTLSSLGHAEPDAPVSFHPRHRIALGAGARLTLIETSRGTGRYLHNPSFHVTVGEGATLTLLRLQDEAEDAFHLSTLHATVAAGATFDSFTLTLGARLARAQIHARLAGPGAAVHLNAAQLLTGSQHADFTTVISHDAPACASRQTVRHVLSGQSHGVFQGKIEVARAAQKTDGYQMNQTLLLSPTAEISSKPQLQIYADDVKCSHGATVGELDAEQLFYLRSRGIPEPEARATLVRAFLAEAFAPISHEHGRALLEAAADSWWSRQ